MFDRPGLLAKNFDPVAEYSFCLRQVWATVLVHAVIGIIPIALGIIGGAVDAPRVKSYGLFCNGACSALIASHWFLQMYETWRMQGIGSLSIFMCLFSVAGSMVSAVTFYQHGGWGVAFPFIVGTISISMATFYALWVENNAKRATLPAEADGQSLMPEGASLQPVEG